jgi:hypothetical protein
MSQPHPPPRLLPSPITVTMSPRGACGTVTSPKIVLLPDAA